MTPPNRFYGPAAPTADKDTRAPRQTPQASAGEATRQVCSVRDCHRAVYRAGLCFTHARTDPNRNRERPHPGLAVRPLRPKRITDALHALAESNPTPAEYERRKKQILSNT